MAAFLTGLALGMLGGVVLAAPLLNWSLPESSATLIGSALGAAAAVFGALWVQRIQTAQQEKAAAQLKLKQDAEKQYQLESLAMTLTPVVSFLKMKIPTTLNRVGNMLQYQGAPKAEYDRLKEPGLLHLDVFIQQFHLLPLHLRNDALQLTALGRLYNVLIEDSAVVDSHVSRATGSDYVKITGDLNGPKGLLELLMVLLCNLEKALKPIHDMAVKKGNQAALGVSLSS